MIDPQVNLPKVSYDWTTFDPFHQPLRSFNEHMAKVIHGSFSDSNPSLFNRVFSIAIK
ncbi:MAG: hypothetical protein H0T62_08305 [Parachlamydiaceae bacterium]|nr:hypothetical protein [Parachlamydiaceae bacterium]